MTDTDEREATAASSPSDPPADTTAAGDPRAAHLAGQRAFKELTAPIRGSMMVSRSLPSSSSSSSARCCWLLLARVPRPTAPT